MASITIDPPTVAAIFDDAGYVFGAISAASFFASIHPEAAEYFGLASIIAMGLANRISPSTATPAQIKKAIDALSQS